MFKAARDQLLKAGPRLAASWRDLRGRGMVGLFLFEPVVVTLGVLLAQSFADWSRGKERDADMEAKRLAAVEAAGYAGIVAAHYEFVIPCFETQMGQIMLAANGEADVDPIRLRRPSVRGVRAVELEADTLDEIAKRHGADHAQSIESANQQAGLLMRRIARLEEGWRAFALLDPRYGTPAPADYRKARESAAEILQTLAGMRFNAATIQRHAARLDANGEDVRTGRSARSCDEMWTYGDAWFDAYDLDGSDQPILPNLYAAQEAR
ncbi:hypothetical protein [Sphingomicrobium sediminis]|uniref:Uncharacterized protein n=1 Tax=Sphingomicrobium sediminis TaxID=2950949 RepID=A0A9X2J5C4_9SPHN|nr:hypothetical protein [Sphingomicrobium sediminis]MCM8558117.1 hypothetical protein [Sphingomicrobium sediminis]